MRRKALSLYLISVLALTGCGMNQTELAPQAPVESAAQSTAQTAEQAAVSNGYVNAGSAEYALIYQMPDETSTAVARGFTGDAIEIYGLQGQWYQVKLDDISGYMKAEQVTFTKPEPQQQAEVQPAEAPAADTPSAETIIVEYDAEGIAQPKSYSDYEEYDSGRNAYCSVESCYIYKSASTTGQKREADKLYKGDAVTVYGTYNGFYYIGTDSGSGYDLMGYVQTKSITMGTPPAAQDKSYSATQGYVDVAECNVRSSPSKENNNNVVETIKRGTTFTILDFDGYWYHISYNGKTGYVSYKMVSVS
ncbi:MAG: SH3 domain-containing protein [Oscillospiraceae bacterium]|nr:SH3 domain-containing protein [Oscillospiraceae bacterium]